MIYFEKYHKYGVDVNSYDVVKFAAIILMLIDHIGSYFFPDVIEFRVLGRFSLPFFFFLIGFNSNFKIDAGLLICAFLLLFVDIFIIGRLFPVNILFSVILVRLFLLFSIQYNVLANFMGVWAVLIIWHFLLAMFIEYGTLTAMIAICGYLHANIDKQQKSDLKQIKLFFIATIISYTLLQILSLKLGLFYALLLITGIAGQFYLLSNFTISKIALELPNIIQVIVNSISRYALLFYTIHLLLIKLSWFFFINYTLPK